MHSGIKLLAQMTFALGLLLAASLVAFAINSAPVLIQSEESLTAELKPVFNKISLKPGFKKDVWMMNQSHHGLQAADSEWERLAIVVDKSGSESVAKFYQLPAGELKWTEDLPELKTAYRAACFTCHNNGPRALRPEPGASEVFMSWQDRLKIQAWNFRIKTYGRVVRAPEQDDLDKNLAVPFRYVRDPYNDKLNIKTCNYCHNDNGFLARGKLERQQMSTIEHMVDRGYMPPKGFSLSAKEKEQLKDFLLGF
jgi:hypothetical protein